MKSLSTDQRIVRGTVVLVLFTLVALSYLFNPSTYHLTDCAFLNLTGLPCPSCGMTRSFHTMAHFHIQYAFALNWFGPVLFFGCVILMVSFLIETISGQTIHWLSKSNHLRIFLFGFLGLWLLFWIGRLLIGQP